MKMFHATILADDCPCGNKNGGCPECEGTGEILTFNGRELLEFLSPFIEARAREIAKEEIRNLNGRKVKDLG
jgi:hypothetical protein